MEEADCIKSGGRSKSKLNFFPSTWFLCLTPIYANAFTEAQARFPTTGALHKEANCPWDPCDFVFLADKPMDIGATNHGQLCD